MEMVLVENSPLDSAEAKVVTPLNFPVFKAKTKDSVFRQRFPVPLVNKDAGAWNPFRPAPALGMRKSVDFIAKLLYHPGGEFGIVLYDPTVNDKKVEITEENGEVKIEEKPMPGMHKNFCRTRLHDRMPRPTSLLQPLGILPTNTGQQTTLYNVQNSEIRGCLKCSAQHQLL